MSDNTGAPGDSGHHLRNHLDTGESAEAFDVVVEDADADVDGLQRTLGPINLMAIGVAAVVGAGIFVVTGEAAAKHAGPAVVIAFVIAGCAASLAALCYSELAGMIPLAGSTYSYAYVSMGTFVAWVIGWDLLVEYLFGAANVAGGWSGYFVDGLKSMGIYIPYDWVTPTIANGPDQPGGILNVPAMVLVLVLTFLLYYGTKLSATATTAFVLVKIVTLAIFVIMGLTAINFNNMSPFIPDNIGPGQFGWSGIFAAVGVLFYSYISFDAVCTAAQEARDPKRTVPIGVLGSLGIATVIFVLVGFVLVGLTSYTNLNVPNPLSVALQDANLNWVGSVIDVGAVVGLAASVLALLYAQTRILMRMSEDGMLPPLLHKVSPKRRTPYGSILICGIIATIMTGTLPTSILTELISIGTLLAFIIVALAVIVLRKTQPDVERRFKVPFGPVIPAISIIVSLAIMSQLAWETWVRLFVWLAIGIIVYFAYSRKRAHAIIAERAERAEREKADIAAGRDPHIPPKDPLA